MRHGPEEQPMLIERRLQLDGLEEIVRSRAGEYRQPVHRFRDLGRQIGVNAFGIAVETLPGIAVQRPSTLEPRLAEERVVAVLALLVGAHVQVEAEDWSIGRLTGGQTVELFAAGGSARGS